MLKPCNAQRRALRSDFESDLAKLESRLMQPLAKPWSRSDIDIADPNKAFKAPNRLSERSEIVDPNLVMVRAARMKVKLNKPIAVGFAILEISK